MKFTIFIIQKYKLFWVDTSNIYVEIHPLKSTGPVKSIFCVKEPPTTNFISTHIDTKEITIPPFRVSVKALNLTESKIDIKKLKKKSG